MKTLRLPSPAVLLLTLFALLSAPAAAHAAAYPAPTVSAISSSAQDDSSGNWYRGTIALSASASDPSGLNSLSLVYDDGSSPTTVAYDAVSGTSATETFQLDTTNVPDGDDCFYVQAVGRGSQSAQTADFCVQISNTAPAAVEGLSTDSDAGNWSNATDSALGFGEPGNDQAPATTVLFTVNGGAVQSAVDQGGAASVGALPEGIDNVCMWLQDAAGNSDPSTEQCVSAYIDRTGPAIGSVTYDNSSQTVSVPVTDAGSGVQSVDISTQAPDGSSQDVGGDTSGSITTAQLPEDTAGAWQVTVTAIDNAGNQSQVTETITVPKPSSGTSSDASSGSGSSKNAGGSTNSGPSASSPAAKPGAPRDLSRPSVTKPKHVKVGAVVKAKAGRWRATGKLTYAYQWQFKVKGRWVKIAKAAKSSWRVARAQRGKDVRVAVRARDAKGASGWAYSAAFKA